MNIPNGSSIPVSFEVLKGAMKPIDYNALLAGDKVSVKIRVVGKGSMSVNYDYAAHLKLERGEEERLAVLVVDEGDLVRHVYTLVREIKPGEQRNLWQGDVYTSQMYQFEEQTDKHRLTLLFNQ